MKVTSLVVVYLGLILGLEAVILPYSTVSYTPKDYRKVTLDGIDFYLHTKVTKHGKDSVDFVIRTYGSFFREINKLTPKTIDRIKSEKYKILLLEEECNGFEVISKTQSNWDKRHNSFTNGSIVVCRTIYGAEQSMMSRYATFPYLLHEAMHIYHMEVIGFQYNWKIRDAFLKASRNKNYKDSDYAFHNFHEYWAEISTAYLLKDGYDPSYVRPPNSKWLYHKDRIGYNLCVDLLGANSAAYKPMKKPPMIANPVVAEPPRVTIIDPATKLPVETTRVTKKTFDIMFYNLTGKLDSANLEEFSYHNGYGGSLSKSRHMYTEVYNLASDIAFYYPNRNKDRISNIIKLSSKKLDLN